MAELETSRAISVPIYGKSLAWVAIALFFGLIQVWVDLFLGVLVVRYHFDLDKLCLSGSLLIFALTLVSTVAADYVFFENKKGKYVRALLWLAWLLPIVMAMFSLTTYVASRFAEARVNISLLRSCNVAGALVAVLYAVALKVSLFKQGDKEDGSL